MSASIVDLQKTSVNNYLNNIIGEVPLDLDEPQTGSHRLIRFSGRRVESDPNGADAGLLLLYLFVGHPRSYRLIRSFFIKFCKELTGKGI